MIEWSDLERPTVQFATREAVVAAMGSPLREPILEAVEERVDGIDLGDAEPNRDAAATRESETDAAGSTEGETDAAGSTESETDAAGSTEGETDAAGSTEGETGDDESADGGLDSAVTPLVGLLAFLALVVAVAYVLRRRIGGE